LTENGYVTAMGRSAALAVITSVIGASVALAAPSPAGADGTTRKALFGKSLVLRGQGREKVSVRPYALADPLTTSEFDAPQPGFRRLGVEVRLRNVGHTRVSDFPSNDADVVTTSGRSYKSTISGGDGCPQPSTTRIPAGQSRLICVAFEIPTGARLRYFEWTLDSGFADQTGQWRDVPPPKGG
jgi:hypothetical protein